MATKDQIAILTGAIITTLRDVQRAPSGVLYAAAMTQGVDFVTYSELIGFLTDKGLIRSTNHHLLTLTPQGIALADRLNARLGM